MPYLRFMASDFAFVGIGKATQHGGGHDLERAKSSTLATTDANGDVSGAKNLMKAE